MLNQSKESHTVAGRRTYRLGVLTQHPIQYHSPRYRYYDQHPKIDLTAFYCCRNGVESYESNQLGGVEVDWDIPLLDGYDSKFLPNLGVGEPAQDGFFSLVNPSVVRELLEHDLDALLVHGHAYFTYHLAIVASRLLNIPLFAKSETHLMLDRPAIKGMLRKPLLSLFYKNFDAFLAIGSKNREFYRAHGVPDRKIFDVPYTVDNEFFRSNALNDDEVSDFKQKHGLSPDREVILYVSKLMERKRPMDLVEAFEAISGEQLDPQLVFVGNGRVQDELEKYVHKRGLDDDVHFMGFRNQSELPSWYSIGDIFVLPSENEPWAVVVNEVMNAGVPVVTTTDVGSAYDLIEDRQTGYMYEPGDVDALSSHIQRLLEDEELREQMGQNALEVISNWGYSEAVQGMVNALEFAVGDK